MTSTEIKIIIDTELSQYQYEKPKVGENLGTPWSESKIALYIPKLKAALIEPYLQKMLLAETYEHTISEVDEFAEYWVIAKDSDYFQWYDRSTNEYGLAQKNTLNNEQYISIGVRGDLVGVYCAM